MGGGGGLTEGGGGEGLAAGGGGGLDAGGGGLGGLGGGNAGSGGDGDGGGKGEGGLGDGLWQTDAMHMPLPLQPSPRRDLEEACRHTGTARHTGNVFCWWPVVLGDRRTARGQGHPSHVAAAPSQCVQ